METPQMKELSASNRKTASRGEKTSFVRIDDARARHPISGHVVLGPWLTVAPLRKQLRDPLILARQITFRNKIPDARVLRRLKLMTTFGDGSLLLGFLPTTRCQPRAGTLSKLGYSHPSTIRRPSF